MIPSSKFITSSNFLSKSLGLKILSYLYVYYQNTEILPTRDQIRDPNHCYFVSWRLAIEAGIFREVKHVTSDFVDLLPNHSKKDAFTQIYGVWWILWIPMSLFIFLPLQ